MTPARPQHYLSAPIFLYIFTALPIPSIPPHLKDHPTGLYLGKRAPRTPSGAIKQPRPYQTSKTARNAQMRLLRDLRAYCLGWSIFRGGDSRPWEAGWWSGRPEGGQGKSGERPSEPSESAPHTIRQFLTFSPLKIQKILK